MLYTIKYSMSTIYVKSRPSLEFCVLVSYPKYNITKKDGTLKGIEV